MKMGTKAIVLIFFYGQLWGSPLSAEIKGPSDPSATFQTPTTLRIGPTTQPFTPSSPTGKHRGLPVSTATTAQGDKLHDGHLIGAVLVGIILVTMIAVIVGIFLWKRLRRTGSVDPHWAGRSPFADGDVLEITTDKEPVQSSKRASVLSLLPWKFNKNTLLSENAEGQPSETGQSPDDPSAESADKRDSQSSPTATENSVSSSTSLQTPISDGPGSLTDIPLQSDDLLPAPADLPPPPSWNSEISKDLCPNDTGSLPLQSPVDTVCSAPPDFSCKNPGEASLFPPPPEEFF
ncbi:PREDICTED: protein EVI2B [Gekko japonicus]|uniref:Protein EVI2B n=1 Tax=Gekko japonicus TaxID=146911 RepID=A0ABM1KUN8_GEKJA|nr:PREDICTED: protein EVI2B [Gekko japonicus]